MRARISVAIASTCLFAALIAAPAQAAGHLTYDFSFGGPGTGAGQFSIPPNDSDQVIGGPKGIAVNLAVGDVYVADEANNRVEQFDAGGNFIRMWGGDVNQTTPGDVCPINPGDVCRAGSPGGDGGWFRAPRGVAVDQAGGAVYVQDADNNRIQKFTADGTFVLMWGKGVDFTSGGDLCTAASGDTCTGGGTTASSAPGEFSGWPLFSGRAVFTLPAIATDSAGYVYAADPLARPHARVQKFDGNGTFVGQIAGPNEQFNEHGLSTPAAVAVNAAGDVYVADPNDGADGTIKVFDAAQFTPSGETASWGFQFGLYGGFLSHASSSILAIDPSNQYLFSGSNSMNCPGALSPTGYNISEFHPAGALVDCTVPSPTFNRLRTGVGGIAVSSTHRLYATDVRGAAVRVFTTPVASAPAIGSQSVTEITATKAVAHTEVVANLDDTTFHLEYGTSPCSTIPNPCASTPESAGIGGGLSPASVSAQLANLTPHTTYHYRFVATNGKGSDTGPDRLFTTYAQPQLSDCPNNLARQQTGAAFLLDCRAYELVSASDQGGYDVESDLAPGQSPFAGFPAAKDKVLYGVHNGVVPNSGGKPTNRGLDPYIASRDQANQRWNTSYVGIPADAPSATPFSSTVSGAAADLSDLSFGAASGFCSPCFGDNSVGIPIHRPDGGLIQGMAGSVPVSLPVPAAVVKKPFSDNGRYFIFGSKQVFEPGANSNNTDATLYERDLDAGTTEIVSTDDSGNAIQNGANVAALDLSTSGDRAVIGKKLGQDSAGNPLYHLYLHLRGAPSSYDITPGTTSGVLYAGMSADGTKAFFTSADQITADDHDSSADLYEADVSALGALAIHRVSVGELGSGDTDFCDPVANSFNSHWNVAPGGPTDCSAVAIGGGGGVASGDGTVYFLSPERLDTSGATQPVQDAPNLYLARPGQDPRFVATLESELTGAPPLAGIYHGFKANFGSFTKATGVAVGPDGSVYVLDLGSTSVTMKVKKFDPAGNPSNFSCAACPAAATNTLNGADAPTGAFLPQTGGIGGSARLGPNQIAVDPASGKLYVPDYGHNVLDVFNADGSYASQLSATTPTGVAINPASHDVYVTRKTAGQVSVFPAGGGVATSFSVSANSSNPAALAVDSTGAVYVANGNKTAAYDASGAFVKILDSNASFGVAVDPASDDVFVDEGNQFAQFDSSGAPTGGADGAGAVVGAGNLTSSVGIALSPKGDVYASKAGTAVALFPRSLLPNPLIDNPLVLHALAEAGAPHSADFGVDPSGEQALFASRLALTGFDNAGHSEVFRYDAPSGQLDCVSCDTTAQPPSTDSSLAADGLSLTDDGRAFFDTGEQLVLRDTDQRKDAYEWSGGKVELVSSGQSSFDSGLLSVSHDGTDAFFFTREKLAQGDQNGSLVRIYDARSGGGFFVIPPPAACVASDECHGAASPTPPAPSIATDPVPRAKGGNYLVCAKRYVKRHGACVKRHAHRKRHHKRGGAR